MDIGEFVEDKAYCSSSFLMYRRIADRKYIFSKKYLPYYKELKYRPYEVFTSDDLYNSLMKTMQLSCSNERVALALSGGIDSAILASMLPKNSMSYTFKCVADTTNTINETEKAKKYADYVGIRNTIVDITWSDYEKYAEKLMKHKGTPIHSIEVQIYKAALQAKEEGYTALVFGESADCIYGGLDKMLGKDRTMNQFADEFLYLKPEHVLHQYKKDYGPLVACTCDGFFDAYKYCSTFFFNEAINSYYNACETAGIKCIMPYSYTVFKGVLDIQRIRSGESKYLIREIFKKIYKSSQVPAKIPMPRPMAVWLSDWNGPTNKAFKRNILDGLSGDQKWLIWSLDKFLNICEETKL